MEVFYKEIWIGIFIEIWSAWSCPLRIVRAEIENTLTLLWKGSKTLHRREALEQSCWNNSVHSRQHTTYVNRDGWADYCTPQNLAQWGSHPVGAGRCCFVELVFWLSKISPTPLVNKFFFCKKSAAVGDKQHSLKKQSSLYQSKGSLRLLVKSCVTTSWKILERGVNSWNQQHVFWVANGVGLSPLSGYIERYSMEVEGVRTGRNKINYYGCHPHCLLRLQDPSWHWVFIVLILKGVLARPGQRRNQRYCHLHCLQQILNIWSLL